MPVLHDIVNRTDCPGDPEAAWAALMRAARFDVADEVLRLAHTDVRVRSTSPSLGVRGTAGWADVQYRVAGHLVPVDGGTRVVLTAVVDDRLARHGAFRRWWSRRLARADLRTLCEETRSALRAHAPACPTASRR